MEKRGQGKLDIFLLPVALLAAGFVLSLFCGKYSLSFSDIFDTGSVPERVFWNLRLGRTLAVIMSGAALSAAGHVFQTVFRNPLASPDIVGVAGGAGTGAAAAIVLLGYSALFVTFGAFLGGMAAVLLVLLLSRLVKSGGTVSLLLAGIAVNAVSQAVLMLIKITADTDQKLSSIEFWLMGSFASVTMAKFLSALPCVIMGLLYIFAYRRRIMLLSLPDDEAEVMGINAKATRRAAIIAATLVTGAAVSITGLISFIGLLAPHIAKRLMSEGKPSCIALSAVVGADLMLFSDMLARSVSVSEIPISVITSLLGAPLLFALLLKGRRLNG